MTEQEHEPVESARPRLEPRDRPSSIQPDALDPEEDEDEDRQVTDDRAEHGPPSEAPDPA